MNFRFPLSLTLTSEKLDRSGPDDSDDIIQKHQTKQNSKQAQSLRYGSTRDHHRKICFHPDHFIKDQKKQLRKQSSSGNPKKQAENSYQKDLNAHQSGQMTFFHSENIVEAKFLFSLFHNETVHIEKNDQRKNTRYRCTDPQKRTHHSFPFHTGNIHHITERTLNVKKCRHDRGRQKIRKIDIPVFPDISPGHFQIEALIHDCFLLL